MTETRERPTARSFETLPSGVAVGAGTTGARFVGGSAATSGRASNPCASGRDNTKKEEENGEGIRGNIKVIRISSFDAGGGLAKAVRRAKLSLGYSGRFCLEMEFLAWHCNGRVYSWGSRLRPLAVQVNLLTNARYECGRCGTG